MADNRTPKRSAPRTPARWPLSTMARASIGRRPRRGSGLAAEPPLWRVVVDHNALKSLRRLSRPDRERIVRAIDQLPGGDVRPLQGEPGCGACASAGGGCASDLTWSAAESTSLRCARELA